MQVHTYFRYRSK